MKELSEDKKQIIREYLEGNSVAVMAKKRGISREAVYQTLRKIDNWDELKEDMSDLRNVASKESAKRAKRDIESGAYIGDTLKKYGISSTTLYRYCPELAGKKRRESMELTERIVKDWKEGVSYRNISKKYDMFISNIQRRMLLYFGDKWEEAKKERAKVRSSKSKRRK